MGAKIVVEINQQQRQMLDRLIEEGRYGVTHAEVIRSGFVEFCRSHPEVAGEDVPTEGER